MTYKEFEEGIKKLGLFYNYEDLAVAVCEHDEYWLPLVWVSQTKPFVMTVTTEITNLSYLKKAKLVELCYKLAITPLDERQTVILD